MLVSIQGSPPGSLSFIPTNAKSGKNAWRPVWINKRALGKVQTQKVSTTKGGSKDG